MDTLTVAVVVVGIGVVVAGLRNLSRPHTVVRIGDGRVAVVRGALPPGLIGDLRDLATGLPGVAGRIELAGGGDRLVLRTPGLDDATAQRVRNVVFLYRDRIRRRA